MTDNSSRIVAEHNMGSLDYFRFDALLKSADQLALYCKLPPFDTKIVMEYYKILDQLFLNFRAIMDRPSKEEIDKKFSAPKQKLFGGSITQTRKNLQIDINLIDDLREMHKTILDVKQIIGYGVPVRRTESQSVRMKRALGL